MVDYAPLQLDIDSAQAAAAAKNLEKFGLSAKKAASEVDRIAKKFSTSYRVTKQFAGGYKDLDVLFNSGLISAQKYAAGIASIDAAQDAALRSANGLAATQRQADAALDAYAASANGAAASAQRFAAAQRGSAMQTANVFAQLNDIGVMLAAGQSPIQLALQQGTQLNQVWAQMGEQGKSLRGVAGMLSSAFMQMINPMSLLTIGVIAGTAALVQWAFASDDAGKKSKSLEDRIGVLSEAITRFQKAVRDTSADGFNGLVDEFKSVDSAVASLIVREKELAMALVQGGVSSAVAGIKSEFSELSRYVGDVDRLQKQLISTMNSFAPGSERVLSATTALMIATRDLREEYGISTEQAKELQEAVNDMASAKGAGELASILNRVAEILSDSKLSGSELHKSIVDTYREALKLSRVDIASGIHSAAGAAQLLAERLGVSLATAQKIAAMGSGVGAGRGGDPRQYGSGWVSGFDVRDADEFLANWNPPKTNTGGGGGGAIAQAEKQFQSLRELLEQETLFQVSEYEKRQSQLDNALAKRLVSIQQYETMKSQLQTFYFGTEYQKAQLNYQMSLEQLNLFHQQGLLKEEAYQIQLAQLRGQYLDQLQSQNNNVWSVQLNQMADAFGQMNSLAGGGYDALLKAQRVFGAASALISTYTGAAKALELGFPQNIIAMGKVLAAGMGLVSAIKSGSSNPKSRGGGGSASTAQSAVKENPTQYMYIRLQGDEWAVSMAENIIEQIYDQSKDGRRIIFERYT